MGRIPRTLDNIEPSPDDLNHSDCAAGIPSLPTASLVPTRSRIRRILLTLRDSLKTTFNSFGLCRLYPHCPSFEPDQLIQSSLLARTSPIATSNNAQATDSPPKVYAPLYPFPNMSIYWLMSWMHSGGNLLSETKVSHLVKDVILADDFDCKDLENFSVRRNLRELDMDESGKRITFPDD